MKPEYKKKSPSRLDRRDFIKYSAVLAGGMTLLPSYGNELISEPLIVKPVAGERYWFHGPLRIMQTVLRETDATTYDTKVVIDYLKKNGYNTLCVNGGGISDFFQNPLPAANINKYMGNRDILKEITAACHAEGIKVIARIDFRGAEEHIYKKFPDWFMVGANGQPVTSRFNRGFDILTLYRGCYLGRHRNEYLNEFVSYILKNYNLDGIWHNAPGVDGTCYCPTCKARYLKDVGQEIPAQNASSAAKDSYQQWKNGIADEYMARVVKTIKGFGAEKAYMAEIFTIYGVGSRQDSGIDTHNARDYFDILVSVAFATSDQAYDYYTDYNYGNTIVKYLKSMAPEREAVILYGGNGTTHRLVKAPSLDTKIWLWEILSAGGRGWNCYFTNVPTTTHDKRNAYNESDMMNFIKTNAKVLDQQCPVGNVGIYFSNATRISYRNSSPEGDIFGSEIRGVETVLMENHIPHDFVIDDQITKEWLKKHSVVILPNVRCMSDKEISLLTDYVREGGNLMATYSTSLYDADGKERSNYGLSELFGVSYAGKKENTRRDNYQYILDKNHPLVAADSPETELLFNSGYTALSKPLAGSKVICTWVPTIENQPPDKSIQVKFSTEYPTVVENAYGKGRVIYYANQPDVLSWIVGHQDPRNLLLRGVRYLAGKGIQLESNAPSSVHICLTKSRALAGQYILSFVNTTSGPVRPTRELIPISNINVKLRLDGKSMTEYKVLRSQGNCVVKATGQNIDLQLSKLQDYCSVHIQMNG